MKDLLKIFFLIFLFALVYIYKENIINFIYDNYINKKETMELISNEYSLDYEFNYIQKTNDFKAKNKQHILNIFYTYLDSGVDEFYFYCDYDDCEKDVKNITKQDTFSNINNFVHPYNTYNKLYITINSWDKVTINIAKSYSQAEIKSINEKLDAIIQEKINDNMSEVEKIKIFHDYIINNTSYDKIYIDNNITDIYNSSHRASGPLLYSKSLCGGYSHAMSLFLNKLKIPNYRISSETHIWNLVYIDNNWFHLDLTWDDPVTSDKSNVLLHKYFNIDTKTLESFNTGKHNFDKNVYIEANQVY